MRCVISVFFMVRSVSFSDAPCVQSFVQVGGDTSVDYTEMYVSAFVWLESDALPNRTLRLLILQRILL